MSGNCPNCGAPKRGAKCEYCGTHFARYQGQATVEVEPEFIDVYSWDGVVLRIPQTPNVQVVINHDSA